jgi:pimeloyl-ACP methyl ester carboxylesterase
MPYQTINGAQIYYQVCGGRKDSAAPILLVHGSTNTADSEWSQVIPALAEQYFVVAPDCRGHGKSSNPNHSYSFSEMASDSAALVHALGFERAHVIGHSNGGNTALVYLMEHADATQTAILQAANAHVTPEMVEREQRVFTPEWVEANDPEWMHEMITLHGPTHGLDYWRELMRMTLQEILAGPNYAPEDLAQVRRPVLVIQGAQDPVNAPGRHGEYIAENIPGSELWVPASVKHNIHKDLRGEWIARVLDFLRRRGKESS